MIKLGEAVSGQLCGAVASGFAPARPWYLAMELSLRSGILIPYSR